MTDPVLHLSSYLSSLQSYWWPFCRIMALISMAPMFSHKSISVRLRIVIALALTVVLGASLPAMPQIDPLSLKGLFGTVEQIVFGAILGLLLQLVFTIFMLVGEVVATQMGMSMARFNDPLNGVSSSSIIYQMYFIALALMFFAIDGHLVTVSVLYQSFVYWPVGSGLHYLSMNSLIQSMSWILAASVLVTLPMVFCLVLVQFCFGLLNRISPAMNLFSLGFPLSILMGLLCILLTLPSLPESYLHLTRELLHDIGVVLKVGGNG